MGIYGGIICKIFFWHIYLTPTWNATSKKLLQNPFFKNLTGTENLTSLTVKCKYNSPQKILVILSTILTIYTWSNFINKILLSSRIAHALSEKWQPFIHKPNVWLYIEYFLLKQILAYLPTIDIECIIKERLLKILSTRTWQEP